MDFAKAALAASQPPTDVLRECAALLFNVPYQDVIDEQRRYCKQAAYQFTYGHHTSKWPSWLNPLRLALQAAE